MQIRAPGSLRSLGLMELGPVRGREDRRPRPMEAKPDHPTLAVIASNWNGEAFIERCLASTLAAVRRLRRPVRGHRL